MGFGREGEVAVFDWCGRFGSWASVYSQRRWIFRFRLCGEGIGKCIVHIKVALLAFCFEDRCRTGQIHRERTFSNDSSNKNSSECVAIDSEDEI